MKIIFSAIAGIFATVLGWSLSQILLIDLILTGFKQRTLPFRPEFILLPIVASCLAVAMVTTEIILSNPTRQKANQRVLPFYQKLALLIGIIAGLIAAFLSWSFYHTGMPDWLIRVLAWGIIGLFTGLAEGISWRFRTIEGATEQTNIRVQKSALFGLGAGLVAAILVELLRGGVKLGGYEDPIGFLIFGLIMGISLNFASAPTYLVALRAGEGFEAIDPKMDKRKLNQLPQIQNNNLWFVYRKRNKMIDNVLDDPRIKDSLDDSHDNVIQEGLSIQLPAKTVQPLLIGSSHDSDIYMPHIPENAAVLTIKRGNVTLISLVDESVQIQRKVLTTKETKSLSHNQILTFYYKDNKEKYYRFIFYDRFLDPVA